MDVCSLEFFYFSQEKVLWVSCLCSKDQCSCNRQLKGNENYSTQFANFRLIYFHSQVAHTHLSLSHVPLILSLLKYSIECMPFFFPERTSSWCMTGHDFLETNSFAFKLPSNPSISRPFPCPPPFGTPWLQILVSKNWLTHLCYSLHIL